MDPDALGEVWILGGADYALRSHPRHSRAQRAAQHGVGHPLHLRTTGTDAMGPSDGREALPADAGGIAARGQPYASTPGSTTGSASGGSAQQAFSGHSRGHRRNISIGLTLSPGMDPRDSRYASYDDDDDESDDDEAIRMGAYTCLGHAGVQACGCAYADHEHDPDDLDVHSHLRSPTHSRCPSHNHGFGGSADSNDGDDLGDPDADGREGRAFMFPPTPMPLSRPLSDVSSSSYLPHTQPAHPSRHQSAQGVMPLLTDTPARPLHVSAGAGADAAGGGGAPSAEDAVLLTPNDLSTSSVVTPAQTPGRGGGRHGHSRNVSAVSIGRASVASFAELIRELGLT
ncbi:hypothetical protein CAUPRSCDRAFT_12480, partial [Caulochytrium protostelioides]